MSDINYPAFIEAAARGSSTSTSIDDLKSAWKNYEQCAEFMSWDAFSYSCRDSMLKLLRMLQLPDFRGSVEQDVEQLIRKDREYGGSWQKRGGCGAFMMLARKWDRIEKQIDSAEKLAGLVTLEFLFDNDLRPEGIIDDIGDLRRYLILIEARFLAIESLANSTISDSQSSSVDLDSRDSEINF